MTVELISQLNELHQMPGGNARREKMHWVIKALIDNAMDDDNTAIRRRCRTTWGPEIELDAEDVGSDGTPEAAGWDDKRNWFAQAEEHFRMIFAIGAEVLFRARMPSAAACVILGANTRSPRRLIARTA
jgi:hypothetical protein